MDNLTLLIQTKLNNSFNSKNVFQCHSHFHNSSVDTLFKYSKHSLKYPKMAEKKVSNCFRVNWLTWQTIFLVVLIFNLFDVGYLPRDLIIDKCIKCHLAICQWLQVTNTTAVIQPTLCKSHTDEEFSNWWRWHRAGWVTQSPSVSIYLARGWRVLSLGVGWGGVDSRPCHENWVRNSHILPILASFIPPNSGH